MEIQGEGTENHRDKGASEVTRWLRPQVGRLLVCIFSDRRVGVKAHPPLAVISWCFHLNVWWEINTLSITSTLRGWSEILKLAKSSLSPREQNSLYMRSLEVQYHTGNLSVHVGTHKTQYSHNMSTVIKTGHPAITSSKVQEIHYN